MTEQLVYLFSCFFSCMIGTMLIFQFMDDRYKRKYTKQRIYRIAALSGVFVATLVNQLQNSILNMMTFFLLCGLFSGLLYSGGRLKGYGRILETEMFFILLGILEGVGGYVAYEIMKYSVISPNDEMLKESFVAVFSKVILLFLYHLLLRNFWKKDWNRNTREYILYLMMFLFSMANMIIVVVGQKELPNYIMICVNWGCLLFANMYIFYYMQMSDEKEKLNMQVAMMAQQENLQFEYYEMQQEKYEQAVFILHDVSKHIRAIEELYQNGRTAEALAYTKEIDGILKPLIPIQYSDNPMLDILLTDLKRRMERLGISFELDLAGVQLGFMEPVDVTTLFGNLLENAIEACKNCKRERIIRLTIRNRYEMLAIRIENTVEQEVRLVDGKPTHPGEKTTGIGTLNIVHCVEKYSGSILYQSEQGKFICDILINK
ncbi:MAG: sensor histidine kinase [Coprococcus sp.]|nr:sensor histidine kinase [Coprococcus sp.]